MLERPTPRLSSSSTRAAGRPRASSASSSSSCGVQPPSVHAKPVYHEGRQEPCTHGVCLLPVAAETGCSPMIMTAMGRSSSMLLAPAALLHNQAVSAPRRDFAKRAPRPAPRTCTLLALHSTAPPPLSRCPASGAAFWVFCHLPFLAAASAAFLGSARCAGLPIMHRIARLTGSQPGQRAHPHLLVVATTRVGRGPSPPASAQCADSFFTKPSQHRGAPTLNRCGASRAIAPRQWAHNYDDCRRNRQ